MMNSGYVNSIDNYCDKIYDELTGIKENVQDLIAKIERLEWMKKKQLVSHVNHLNEIAETIDGKLKILSQPCPMNVKGLEKGFEKISVI